MYTTTITPTRYYNKVMREAKNKKEIKQQIREMIEEVMVDHKWWNNTIEIYSQNDDLQTETLFFTIKIIERKFLKSKGV